MNVLSSKDDRSSYLAPVALSSRADLASVVPVKARRKFLRPRGRRGLLWPMAEGRRAVEAARFTARLLMAGDANVAGACARGHPIEVESYEPCVQIDRPYDRHTNDGGGVRGVSTGEV